MELKKDCARENHVNTVNQKKVANARAVAASGAAKATKENLAVVVADNYII